MLENTIIIIYDPNKLQLTRKAEHTALKRDGENPMSEENETTHQL